MKQIIETNQKGFTLVELLVGLFISLFIVGVAVTFLVTSSRTLTNQSSEDLIQENARFAFEILSSNIRLTGLNEASNDENLQTDGIFIQPICMNGTNCNANSVNYNLNGQNIDSDSVAFDYILNSGTTCTGNQIVQETKVVTVFFVSDLDGDGIASLNCRSFEAQKDPFTPNFINFNEPNANGLAIIDGIDSMQVQYGVDVNNDGDVERYSSFNNLSPTDQSNVKSIKIGFLVNSGQTILGDQGTEARTTIVNQQIQNRTYQVFDGTNVFNDLALRQIYTTTIFLPNRN